VLTAQANLLVFIKWKPNMCHEKWLEQVSETIINPKLKIIDPHHHLWHLPDMVYELDDFHADTQSGHNIVKTVFIEGGIDYTNNHPAHLKPVSETEYAVALAKKGCGGNGPEVAGIVGRADLTLGEAVEDVLDHHREIAGELLKGIRQIAAWDPNPEAISVTEIDLAAPDLYTSNAFRRGLKRLGQLGYSFDAWHYHHQLKDFIELVKAVPETTFILDHFGTPLGVGPYRHQRNEIVNQWQKDIKNLAQYPNVYAKLGGLAMPDNGFSWHLAKQPPTSDEFVAAQAAYYHHSIECFGPARCMFESNFPVDKESISYHVLYNGFKKIAASYAASEQQMMFYGTAENTYKL
jgi:predicted TIM-barrel fold metal-dependent hydrolase